MLFDTHCHLNDRSAFPDPAVAIAAAVAAGVDRMAVVGVDREGHAIARELVDQFSNLLGIYGWHPNSAREWDDETRKILLEALAGPRAIALGEIGLDYHWDFATKEQQMACLDEQLRIAAERDLPVVFHCREAYDDLLGVLESRPVQPYLIHCFAGSMDEARRAVALGCYFGVDGPITYKKADALREIVAELPRDRVVLETDSPWMPPHPHRSERNRPALLPLINERLAEIWSVTPKESAAITTENAYRFFRMPLPA